MSAPEPARDVIALAELHDGVHPSPYCLHDHHYNPRCRRCHRRYDLQEVMPYV